MICKRNTVCILTISFALALLSSSFPQTIRIVYAERGGWLSYHSALELSKYFEKLTSAEVLLLTDEKAIPQGKIVLIGNPTVNKLVQKLEPELRLSEILPANPEGFVIKTFGDDAHKYLILAGSQGIGDLYAVYEYLERFCTCGFFADGEYIPKLEELPFDNIEVIEQPRFKYRSTKGVAIGAGGLKKFNSTFWTKEDYIRRFDWMAKNKLNLCDFFMAWNMPTAGLVPYEVFPELGKPVEEPLYQAGFAIGWGWPADYRAKLYKQVIEYGRRLGIKFFYGIGYGDVPAEFAVKHPELKYVGKGAWQVSRISPEDPACRKYMLKYMRAFIKYYGTDNLYYSGIPHAEELIGATREEGIKAKMATAKQFYEVIKELDPDAKWITDSWDFSSPWWREGEVKQFLDLLGEDILIYDTNADYSTPQLYKRFGYYYGKPWGFGVLNSFGGDDALHGNIDTIILRIKEVATDPKASNCQGVFMVPELHGDNVLYWHLVAQLAWRPEKTEKDSFLKDYAMRRYGKISYQHMKRAIDYLVKAVYENPPAPVEFARNNPFFQFPYFGSGSPQGFPFNADQDKILPQCRAHYERTLPPLRRAIEIALREKHNQRNNPLYENDLVDMFRTYLGLVSNLQLIDIYEAFKTSDAEKFEEAVKDLNNTLEAIEKVLSTRRDFSLEATIEQVMSVKGANKYAPEMIKTNSIVGCYPTHDCFELMHLYYRPRINLWVDLLRKRMEMGINSLTLGELVKALPWESTPPFVHCPIHVVERYEGKPIDAIEKFFENHSRGN